MRLVSVSAAIALVLSPGLGLGQPDPAPSRPAPPPAASGQRLTLERLFAEPALNGPSTRAPAISPDGKLVTWLRGSEDDALRLDLWAAPVAGGAAFRLVDSRRLAPDGEILSEAEKARRERQRISGARGLVSYNWDSKGEAILAPLGGDLWLVPVAAPDRPRQLTATPQFEIDGRVSPAGRHVSFVRDQALWTLDLASNRETRVSPEASGAVSWGVAEFIAQEEMDRDEGYWWAPDDSRIAFARVDETGVAMVPRVEIAADGNHVVEQRYPRAGAANAKVDLFIANPDGAGRVQVSFAEPDEYLARVDWSPDGRVLWVQTQNRGQNRLALHAVDPRTGEARLAHVLTDPTWVNLTDDFRPLSDGGFIISEEGPEPEARVRRLARYTPQPDGRLARRWLTPGDVPVRALSGVDEAGGKVYFTASRDAPLDVQLYAAPLDGRAPPAAVTPGGGLWQIAMAKNAKSFLGTFQSPDTPPRLGLFDASGRLLRWIEENRLDANHPWAAHMGQRASVRFGEIEGPSGDRLHWSMLLPPDFDPNRIWPVIVYVYGGPGVQVVQNGWGTNVDQFHAQRGYIVFRLDNRGTPHRGRDFERAIHGRFGQPEVEDQLAGLAHLRELPFVDPARIGVWGWSYGGYMALRLATEAPDAFAAYAAGAPVTDWRLYDTHYTERYMGGLPQGGPVGDRAQTPEAARAQWDRVSVLPRLERVTRPLLILHGMADDNVTFDHAAAAFDRLQAKSVPFEAMVYPGQRHAIRDPARARHVQATLIGFFDRHLGPGPRLRPRPAPAAPQPAGQSER